MLSVYSAIAATRANQQRERKQITVRVSYSFAGGCFERSLANVVGTNVAQRPVTAVRIAFWEDRADRELQAIGTPRQTIVRGKRLVTVAPDAGLPARLEDGDVIVMRYSLGTLAREDDPRLVEVFDAEGGSVLHKLASLSKVRRQIVGNGGGCKNDPMPGPPL